MKKNKLLNKKEIIYVLGKRHEKLAEIFSDKFGIVNAILKRYELDRYSLCMYQCLSANTVDLFGLSREVSSGGLGVNENEQISLISCLAEALERYCMSYIPQKEIVRNKKENLTPERTFDNFFTYSDEQYKNNNMFLNPNSEEIEWTKVYNIENKKQFKYWPASLIYLPYDINKTVAENTSTGMAAGFELDECIKSGLFELIERDALMINFMQRLNPPEIDLNTISGTNIELIREMQKEYTIKIYKLYSDIEVPIFLSIIYRRERNHLHYGIGSCANLNSDHAINKSLKECLFTYFYSLNIMNDRQSKPEKIKTLYEHFLYYQGDNFKELLFKSEIIEYKKEVISFNELKKNLKQNNINVYYKELTTDDIKTTGIKVVKVVAPCLIDLNKSHIYPRLGATRFFLVPEKLNLKYSKKLTDMPHPFP